MTVEHRATLWMQQERICSGKASDKSFELVDIAAIFTGLGASRRERSGAGGAFRCRGHGFIARFVPDVALSGWNNLVSFDAG